MLIKYVTAGGEEHGLINTLSNHVPDNGGKDLNPKIKSSYEKKKKDDARMVKARYICKNKNDRLDKPYCRYAGDPIQIYHLIPGYTYDLPMGFIEEVNEIKTVQRSGLVSLDGEPLKRDESPLDADREDDPHHQLVPVNF